MLLEAVIKDFLGYMKLEVNRSSTTVKGYNKDLKVLKKFLGEKVTLKDIDYTVLSSYIQFIARDKKYEPATIRRHISAIQSLYNFLEENEYIVYNPAAKLIRPKLPQRHPEYLYKEQVDKLMAAVPTKKFTQLRDLTIIKVLFYSGVRVDELVALKREDIDFTEKLVKVKKGKGGKFRSVPMHPELEKQLIEYLKKWDCPKGYLFYNSHKNALTTERVRQVIAMYAKKAKIKKQITPHTLRHSFATRLSRQGVDIFTLKELLGHESLSTTSGYIHSDMEQLKKTIMALPPMKKVIDRKKIS